MFKEFIQKWIIHNLHYKIIALILAVVLWFVFTNMKDPIRTYSYLVPIEVLHQTEFAEQGRYLEIEGSTEFSDLSVEVYVQARTSVQENLRSKTPTSFLKAYVDLYELSSDDKRLLIYYEFTDPQVAQNAEINESRSRSYLSVDIEENIVVEIPVQVVITGQPDDGYLYIDGDPNIQINPSTITLTGPANQVSQFDHGKVSISVYGANANINKTGQVILEDASGRAVSYSRDVVRASVSEVSVFVPIYIHKTVSMQPYLTGSAPEGYEYTGDISLDYTSVQIYGPESTLNKVNNIRLPDIDISDIRGEYEKTFDLQAILDELYGAGVVKLMMGTSQTVTVSFTIGEQIEQMYEFYTEEISILGLGKDFELAFKTLTVSVTLYGLPSEFEAFNPNNLRMTLRLKTADLTAGEHTGTLDVSGLGGLQCDGATVTFTITKIEKPEESSETEESSQ